MNGEDRGLAEQQPAPPMKVLFLTWVTLGPGFFIWNPIINYYFIIIIISIKSFKWKVSGSHVMKQSTFSHKQPLHPSLSRAACLAPSPWGFSPCFSQLPILVHYHVSKKSCRLIQRQTGMLRWAKCQVGYTVGRGRRKTTYNT